MAIKPRTAAMQLPSLLETLIPLVLAGLAVYLFFSLKEPRVQAAQQVLVDVATPYSAASPEEVERQVTIPLEVNLAGMKGLKCTHSQSLFGLCLMRLEFEKGTDYHKARWVIVSRLQFGLPQMPDGVSPLLGPTYDRAILRYTLNNPRDTAGKGVYSPGDLQALQDWTLERELARVPGVAGVLGSGGTRKRYEVQPDPDRLKRYAISLSQLEKAIAKANANVGGGVLPRARTGVRVRAAGLIGAGRDPMDKALTMKDAKAAAVYLRAEEARRLKEIRALVIARVNNQPIRVEDVVEGGRQPKDNPSSTQGVVVSREKNRGRVGLSRLARDQTGKRVWVDEDDRVEGAVFLQWGADPGTTLTRIKAKLKELSATPGRMLPGVRIEPYEETGAASAARQEHFWIQGTFPINISEERLALLAAAARAHLREHPFVQAVVSHAGSAEDGFEAPAFHKAHFHVGLKPRAQWPKSPKTGQPSSLQELRETVVNDLAKRMVGADWVSSPIHRDDFGEAFVPAPGEELLKIAGPDLAELERRAGQARGILQELPGIEKVHVLSSLGAAHLELRPDMEKCRRWGVTVAEVNQVLRMALGGKWVTHMVEGEKFFDIALRWPNRLRGGEVSILDTPVDIINNQVVGLDSATEPKPLKGSKKDAKPAPASRLRLRDLVTPLGKDGRPDPKGQLMRIGAAVIFRENGKRLIPIRFSIVGKEPAAVRAEAQKKTARLFKTPYQAEWVTASK